MNEETIFENNLHAIDKSSIDLRPIGPDAIIPLSQAEIETCGPYLNLVITRTSNSQPTTSLTFKARFRIS